MNVAPLLVEVVVRQQLYVGGIRTGCLSILRAESRASKVVAKLGDGEHADGSHPMVGCINGRNK